MLPTRPNVWMQYVFWNFTTVISPQGITDNKMEYFWKYLNCLYILPQNMSSCFQIIVSNTGFSKHHSWHSSVCSLNFYHTNCVTCFEVTVLSVMYALQCTHCTGSLLLEAMSGGSYRAGALLSYSRSSLAVGDSQPLPLAPTTIIITSLWDTQPLLLSAHATIF